MDGGWEGRAGGVMEGVAVPPPGSPVGGGTSREAVVGARRSPGVSKGASPVLSRSPA